MRNTITRVKFVNDFKSQCHLAFCACKTESGVFVRHAEANGWICQ